MEFWRTETRLEQLLSSVRLWKETIIPSVVWRDLSLVKLHLVKPSAECERAEADFRVIYRKPHVPGKPGSGHSSTVGHVPPPSPLSPCLLPLRPSGSSSNVPNSEPPKQVHWHHSGVCSSVSSSKKPSWTGPSTIIQLTALFPWPCFCALLIPL